MKVRVEEYRAVEGQLETIDQALDAVMIAIHILKKAGDGPIMVSPETLASTLTLAYVSISDTTDAIREEKLT